MTVYILEFSRPLGNPDNPRGTARYYLGSCDDGRLDDRLAEHRAGWGAKITAAANAAGITYEVVATLPGGRAEERRYKRWHKTRQIVEMVRRRRGQAHEE